MNFNWQQKLTCYWSDHNVFKCRPHLIIIDAIVFKYPPPPLSVTHTNMHIHTQVILFVCCPSSGIISQVRHTHIQQMPPDAHSHKAGT